jgi:hypothetical protein
VSLFAGGGGVVDELYKNEGFADIGAELSKPFHHRWWLDSLLAYAVGVDFQFTERPYRAVVEKLDPMDHHQASYQRQLASISVGAVGMVPCPSCGWWDGWLRVSVGRGTAIYSDDEVRVGDNDFVWGPQVALDLRIGAHLAIEGYGGALFGEDLHTYTSTLHGNPVLTEDSGTLDGRWLLGLRLKVRP